ncbi:MAG: hypothetical protein ABR606_16375 [Vicinamibacterales bacterium]
MKSHSVADDNGLLSALRRYASRFTHDTGIAVEVTGDDAGRRGDRLDADLFQMALEALSNVRRHTTSLRAAIRLLPSDGYLTLASGERGARCSRAERVYARID